MASVLVPVADVVAFLGDVEATDTTAAAVLGTLIDQVEAAFLSACGRTDRPFAAAATRTEVHDGTGTATLWLHYPITTLTSVILGLDVLDPDDTLAVDDQTELAWRAGSARLRRTDGGVFGAPGVPNYVTVVYDAAADLPSDAALAITHATAMLWRRLGSEGLTMEGIGPYQSTFAELMAGNGSITAGDPIWRAAVAAHREIHT